jgi:hypothetical protein
MKAGRNARLRVAVVMAMIVASLAALGAPAGASQAWKVVPTAAGVAYGSLASVSCPSASSCFAVGTHDAPNLQTRVIERWNGARWIAVVTPSPPGATSSQLLSVQCTSPASCVAVGQYTTAALKTNALVLHYDGARWTIQATPSVPGAAVTGLAGVQCTTSASCVAVGSYFPSPTSATAPVQLTLVEQWNGAAWAIVPSPNPAIATASSLAGVTCTAATTCFAVGQYSTQLVTNTLIEQFDGTSWTIAPSPNPTQSTFSQLNSVSCTSGTNCMAVGSGHGTLAEQWNGATWAIVTSANPTGATSVSFTAVTCPSVVRCFAVGNIFRKTVVQRMVQMWNGSRWSLVTVPVPPGSVVSSLSGVSCNAITSCFTVGFYRVGPSRRPLLIRYS